MLSAVIRSALGYPAYTVGTITGTPAVRPSRSSRTEEGPSQCSNACTGYGPNCLTTFWTQLTYRFNGRTAQPLARTTAPGGEEPTSRCQTFPSMWTLGEDQPVHIVIARVLYLRLLSVSREVRLCHRLSVSVSVVSIFKSCLICCMIVAFLHRWNDKVFCKRLKVFKASSRDCYHMPTFLNKQDKQRTNISLRVAGRSWGVYW